MFFHFVVRQLCRVYLQRSWRAASPEERRESFTFYSSPKGRRRMAARLRRPVSGRRTPPKKVHPLLFSLMGRIKKNEKLKLLPCGEKCSPRGRGEKKIQSMPTLRQVEFQILATIPWRKKNGGEKYFFPPSGGEKKTKQEKAIFLRVRVYFSKPILLGRYMSHWSFSMGR